MTQKCSGEHVASSAIPSDPGTLPAKVVRSCASTYVSGATTRSNVAIRNLKRICEEPLAGRYRIEIVDFTKNPQLGLEDQIQALPTLVRKRPPPIRKILGILFDTEQVLASLDLGRTPPGSSGFQMTKRSLAAQLRNHAV
jgi:circadian clock protein KaiB